MNREIKFRGKRIATGKWIEGNYVKISDKHGYIIGHFGNPKYSLEEDIFNVQCVCHKVSNKTIGQYTGLKDKSGVEIFEGDIITFDGGQTESRKYMLCKWSNEQLCYMLFAYKENWSYELGDCLLETLEVIGNIYDNPELLEAR